MKLQELRLRNKEAWKHLKKFSKKYDIESIKICEKRLKEAIEEAKENPRTYKEYVLQTRWHAMFNGFEVIENKDSKKIAEDKK